MRNDFDFGCCEECSSKLRPTYFIEEETERVGSVMIKTGRKRRAVSHLTCPTCFKNYCVDDSFDGRWH